MINHFVKFLYRKIFLVMVGLFIIIGAAVVIIPANIIHAATVNCPPQIQEGSTNTVEVNELHSALQSHYKQGDLKNGKPYNFLATSNGAFGGGFGLETRKAVMDYQSQHGLGVDGVVGTQTWGSLLGVACGSDPKSNTTSNSTISTGSTVPKSGTCYPNISEGTSDSATTKILQNILISKGYSVGSSGADGQFGPNTTNAVEAFQRSAKIGVDGRVGSQTWKALGYCSSNSSNSSNNNASTSGPPCKAGETPIYADGQVARGSSSSSSSTKIVKCSSTQSPVYSNGKVISCINISDTMAYRYCQDGAKIFNATQLVDCSQSNVSNRSYCDSGYWGDSGEIAALEDSVNGAKIPENMQQEANQACNAIYTG